MPTRATMARLTYYVFAFGFLCSALHCQLTKAYEEVDVMLASGISARTPGVRETKTPEGGRAFKVRPKDRDLGTDQGSLERLLRSMKADEGFILITVAYQDPKNRGTLVSVDRTDGQVRGFGFHIDRRNDEAVVQFAEFGAGEPQESQVVFSPLNIGKDDTELHTFVLDVRGNLVTLYMDCQLIGLKILPSSFYMNMEPDNMKLRLGKGLPDRNNVLDFKGTLAVAKFAFQTSTTDVLISQGCEIEPVFSSSQISFGSSFPLPIGESEPSHISSDAAMPGGEGNVEQSTPNNNNHGDSGSFGNSGLSDSMSFGGAIPVPPGGSFSNLNPGVPSSTGGTSGNVMPQPVPGTPPHLPTNMGYMHPNAAPTDDTMQGQCAYTCEQISNLNNQVQVLSDGYDDMWNKLEHFENQRPPEWPSQQGCWYMKTLYDDGDVFKVDKCKSCECRVEGGLPTVECSLIKCQPGKCANPIIMEGDCCPTCPNDNLGWSDWAEWTSCSVTCGNGIQQRGRSCDRTQFECNGNDVETRVCYLDPCIEIVDGGWSNFTPWSCGVTCGNGTESRMRSCNSPRPKNGGKRCDGELDGAGREERPCGRDPCPVDGQWGQFSEFTPCTKTCDGGWQERYRFCDSPPPAHGGRDCVGSDTHRRMCNEWPCPIDACLSSPCFDGVECVSFTDGRYECKDCPVGYTGNGILCQDINECLLVSDACFNFHGEHRCLNLIPGYTCRKCPIGYRGNQPSGMGVYHAKRYKQQCIPINPCAEGTSSCHIDARCIFYGPYSDPQYGCKCKTGFAGDGVHCGYDSDLDGWPDEQLDCEDHGDYTHCTRDNCASLPNSGQEDNDGDGKGDACDADDDDDLVDDVADNCQFISNWQQFDIDDDGVGDVCDNCPFVSNTRQEDTDSDGDGDVCDYDIDEDGIYNEDDNCMYVANARQLDFDEDGYGDVCDNCPDYGNPDQMDIDDDNVGDVCDTDRDVDNDGHQDDLDNCWNIANSDQADHDMDGIGDACDFDDDNDGIEDVDDNCRLIFNPSQNDTNENGRGDACEYDNDGDGVTDLQDACPDNANIQRTDLSHFQLIKLDPEGSAQIDPHWIVRNRGQELVQTINSDPGLAIGYDEFNSVEFSGTFYVNTERDDDYAGFVFGYQSNHRFYSVMWKQVTQKYWEPMPTMSEATAGLQLKLINSTTGPGEYLRNALWHTGDTSDQVKLIWSDANKIGWKDFTAYRWILTHRPRTGYIRVTMYEGSKVLADSGALYDFTLQGGRIGLFCFSQEMVFFSDLQYKCLAEE
ncbi:thrombospondin-1-like isoform X1 [Patiria miniata]|uniref:Thrombospondin n=1 Tax=Patiria miniata TaxID=46514 RepID=A0A914BRJ0_PATMI|nr:thrombospondin-1-like isoform X1 [Patiria miniata]